MTGDTEALAQDIGGGWRGGVDLEGGGRPGGGVWCLYHMWCPSDVVPRLRSGDPTLRLPHVVCAPRWCYATAPQLALTNPRFPS